MSIEEKVKHLDPREVLKRGYTLSSIDGSIIKSLKDLPDNTTESSWKL